MQIPSITPAEVPPDAYLLDVREPDEWAAGHIPSAAHLPMMDIPARRADVPQDREVVVICRVGGRSGQVVDYLRQHGWNNVINLDGGMIGWEAAGRPMVAEDRHPPKVI